MHLAYHQPQGAINNIAAGAYSESAAGRFDSQFAVGGSEASQGAGLVLYPHFQHQVVPGWLDKALRWRHKATPALDSMVVLSPDPQWVKTLPNAKLPDRQDFTHYGPDTAARSKAWLAATGQPSKWLMSWPRWLQRPDMGWCTGCRAGLAGPAAGQHVLTGSGAAFPGIAQAWQRAGWSCGSGRPWRLDDDIVKHIGRDTHGRQARGQAQARIHVANRLGDVGGGRQAHGVGHALQAALFLHRLCLRVERTTAGKNMALSVPWCRRGFTPPRLWLSECTAPALWKAMAPCMLALIMFRRASRSLPLRVAFSMAAQPRSRPSSAMPSAGGLKAANMKVSMQCAMASMPVAAVSMGAGPG